MIGVAAILLSAGAMVAIDRNPCGVPAAHQIFVLPAYSDHEVHRVKVDERLDLDVQSILDGPIEFQDATSGSVVYSMARDAWDGNLKRPNGVLPESGGLVAEVTLRGGTLIIDPSSTLSRGGPFVFVCWKPNARPVSEPGHHAEIYQRIERLDDWTGLIRRKDGSSIPLPQLRHQVQVEGTAVSADGKRVGWLVDLPNCCTSYAVPTYLVTFRNGKIEGIFEEGQGIFDWAFVRKGAAVSYFTSTLHGTDHRSFFLRDAASGRLLGTYDYPDTYEFPDSEERRAAAVAAAPGWVRAIGSSVAH